MKNRITEDLKQAMRNQDKELLTVIRMLKGAIQLEEINLKRELTEEEIISAVSRQIKMRKESIVEFEKGKREDLINQTQNEIDILMKYLPKQLSTEEVYAIINDAFDKIRPSSVSDMGKLMGVITPLVKGKYDMGEVSKKVKEKLNNNN